MLGLVRPDDPMMPEFVNDLPSRSCYHLFFGSGIEGFQLFRPDRSVLAGEEKLNNSYGEGGQAAHRRIPDPPCGH